MSKPVVLIAEELSPATIDALGPDFEVRHVDGADRAALLPAIADVDAILIRSATKVDAEALAAAKNLKVVARAGVGLDRATGIGWAGGYVGDGLSTTNLAGRTLADLVLERDTELVHLPWVGHRSPNWELEPLRFIGANAGMLAMTAADAEERATGRPSLVARMMAPLIGH